MIRGKKSKLAKTENVTRINPTINASIHNRFDIEVVDAKTGEVKQRAYAENVVLDNWWLALEDAYVNSQPDKGPFYAVAFGNGQGLPSAADTDLFARFGFRRLRNAATFKNPSHNSYSITKKVSLSETEFAGKVFTEVGLVSTDASNNYKRTTTHAMLKDMSGNQISLAKTDTDIFNISATVFLHWNFDGYTNGSIMVALDRPHSSYGDTYPIMWIAQFIMGNVSGSSAADEWTQLDYYIARAPISSKRSSYSDTVNMSVNGVSKKIELKCKRIGVGSQNLDARYAVIGSVDSAYGSGATTYYHYAPFIVVKSGTDAIPGTQIAGETIGTGDGTTKEFKTKFSLVENAVVYLNGVEKTAGVRVDQNPWVNASRYIMGVNSESTLDNIIPTEFAPLTHYDKYARFSLIDAPCPTDKTYYIYNPAYKDVGFEKVILQSGLTSVSLYVNNGIDDEWIYVGGGTTISDDYKNYPFLKVVCSFSQLKDGMFFDLYCEDIVVNNIHFDEPPPAGAIITADYFTKTIAKDENHVFDFSITIQLGEYTGE